MYQTLSNTGLQKHKTAKEGATDLSKLKTRSKSKVNYTINELKTNRNCLVEVSLNDNNGLLRLFFQDPEIRRVFEANPEIIFIDEIQCLHRHKLVTSLWMGKEMEL